MYKSWKHTATLLKLPFLLILTAFIFNNTFSVVRYGLTGINWQSEINTFLFGLVFFLAGIDIISKSMKKWAGDALRSILATLTSNRILGVFIGGIVTAVISSSSATVGMLVSFVKSALMTFPQTLGPILGADIGTTVTAWIVTFNLTEVAKPIFLTGFLLSWFYRKNYKITNLCMAVMGFGLLFLGIKIMNEVIEPLKEAQFLGVYIDYLKNPFLGILAGTIFTAIINSSSATTAMVVTLAGSGLITLDVGILLIFGANIGTCVTAIYISQGDVRDGKRVALAHILFKVLGVLLFVWWVPFFAEIVRWVTIPLGALPKTQMATAHTMFNLAMALLFIPFILPIQRLKFSEKYNFANLIYWLIPKKKIPFNLITWHLDKNLLDTPAFAIAETRKRISELFEDVYRMLQAIIIPYVSDPKLIQRQGERENWPQEEIDAFIEAVPKQDEQNPTWTIIEGIEKREEAVDEKKRELEEYRRQLISKGLKEDEIKEIDSIILIANHLENIADVVHDKLLPLLDIRRNLSYDLTDEGKQDLMVYHNAICNPLKQSTKIFSDLDPRVRKSVRSQIKKNKKLYENLRNLHLKRFQEKEAARVTDEIHEKFLECMKNINNYIDEITKRCDEILLIAKM